MGVLSLQESITFADTVLKISYLLLQAYSLSHITGNSAQVLVFFIDSWYHLVYSYIAVELTAENCLENTKHVLVANPYLQKLEMYVRL